ncbi:MAG: hypothetical protein HS122_15645 [Opitutaceae bacterium]|nr:hypothetical protein [Opitutaceae bacterium]
MSVAPVPTHSARQRQQRVQRIFHFTTWADRLETAADYLARLPRLDVSRKVSDPHDQTLIALARLDCDWHAENVRVFDALAHPALRFEPAHVVGANHMAEFLQRCRGKPASEDWWLVFMGQHPQGLAGIWRSLGPMLRKLDVRILYYAFDEASRTMPCFQELAPHLDILVHDECPLEPQARSQLRTDCLALHRSWVANCLPFSVPFEEEPERTIVFLGSKMGLTPHRQRQVDFLEKTFKDAFRLFADHSIAVAERSQLRRYKVSLCPEGRKFATPAMAATHTDRPFWSGCMGMVPVSEDSAAGGRLESLAKAGLILRYGHGNLRELGEACEQALALDRAARRRIYEHFNREETVGTVVAGLIAGHQGMRRAT